MRDRPRFEFYTQVNLVSVAVLIRVSFCVGNWLWCPLLLLGVTCVCAWATSHVVIYMPQVAIRLGPFSISGFALELNALRA